ncbi:MAG: hypothetical protein EBU23_03560 [Mycobacteriaceae bacterium]|nr:hypothetical protein [Mycobacteriaceae bacterium]
MAQQVYPSNVIVRNLRDNFFRYRHLALAPRSLARDAEAPVFDDDRVISDMEQFGYLRLDAVREAPRGARDWVVILILRADGKYSHHSPDLRKLLDGLEAERPAKEGRLDEVIVVAEDAFFSKKNLTDVVREAQQKQAGGPDLGGSEPFYNAYPYRNFALVIPEHHSVPKHRIMDPPEVEALLRRQHITRGDLPIILTKDPPVIWIGGREGQVVEIARDPLALYYRRIERAAF